MGFAKKNRRRARREHKQSFGNGKSRMAGCNGENARSNEKATRQRRYDIVKTTKRLVQVHSSVGAIIHDMSLYVTAFEGFLFVFVFARSRARALQHRALQDGIVILVT